MNWNDLYRPSEMYEIDDKRDMFLHCCEKKNLPHLLLHGPSSSGKSLFIHTYARRIFVGRILEINSCDEHGIEVIREKIKNFSKVAGIKLIIIDEFQYQNTIAQAALRRIIEDYSNSTRFCFITRDISKVIEPIRSRCIILRFERLSLENNLKVLQNINEKEKLNLTDEYLKQIINLNDRDTRKIIHSLQFPSYISNRPIFTNVNPYTIIENGILVHEFLKGIFTNIVTGDFDDSVKCQATFLVYECEKNLFQGGDEFLNLNKLFIDLDNLNPKIMIKTNDIITI